MAEHEHEHHHGHDHGGLTFETTNVDDETLTLLKGAHPKLAENLDLARRFGELDEGEKENLALTADECLEDAPWFPGFHSENDACAVCEKPTSPLFEDRFQGDLALPYAAFLHGLPVHVGCVAGFSDRYPKPAPRVLDMARRRFTQDLTRPTPEMAAFFRRDSLANEDLDLEAWANGVLEENADRMNRSLHRDIERCAIYLHERLFHAH